jgi:nicotinamide-nucleotide amidase
MPALSPIRTAEVIAVGSEMLGTTRVDTNSLHIAARLSSLGIELRAKTVVGDDRGDIASVFRQSLERADLVVLTGGLGPTDDDLTREVVAEVLSLEMHEDPAIVQAIEQRFARRGLQMPPSNLRQAQVPEGARVLANPRGTAPGLFLEHGGRMIAMLPGPPREMRPLLDELCKGPIGARAGAERIYRASLFVAGRGESHVEQIVQPIYSGWRDQAAPIATTILAAPGQIELHLSTRDANPEIGRRRIAAARDALAAALGEDAFSTDGRSMEEIVGALLAERRYRIAAAESCTGGLFTSRLTDVPGSSAYVYGALVAYDNRVKARDLQVPQELLDQHGAVSEPAALAMLEGVLRATGVQVGVAITGIAGPGGGTPEKPVGTVVIAVAVPDKPPDVRTYQFMGDRSMIKFWSTQTAMDRIRRLLK